MTSSAQYEQCPDCRAILPKQAHEGASHRYIGASPSCWTLFSNLLNAGEPPLAPGRLNSLLLDAYAAQHHGRPSPQATQSVAVHALVLYGVLHQGAAPKQALWIRRRALHKVTNMPKHGRFHWLMPPDFTDCLTVADVVQASTPAARTEKVQAYVTQVWSFWAEQHLSTFAQWYELYVVSDEV